MGGVQGFYESHWVCGLRPPGSGPGAPAPPAPPSLAGEPLFAFDEQPGEPGEPGEGESGERLATSKLVEDAVSKARALEEKAKAAHKMASKQLWKGETPEEKFGACNSSSMLRKIKECFAVISSAARSHAPCSMTQ